MKTVVLLPITLTGKQSFKSAGQQAYNNDVSEFGSHGDPTGPVPEHSHGPEREPSGSSTSLLSSRWSPRWGGHPSLLGAASEGQRVWGEESGRVQPVPRGNGKLGPWWSPSSIDHLTWKRTFKFQAVFTSVTMGR